MNAIRKIYRKAFMTMSNSEIQSEYLKACERGYGFTNHGEFCHYLFAWEQIEPVTRAQLDKEYGRRPFYIWTIKGGTLGSTGLAPRDRLRIAPCPSPLNWTDQCRAIAAQWDN